MDLDDTGHLAQIKFLIRDRDAKYPVLIDKVVGSAGIASVPVGCQNSAVAAELSSWSRRAEDLTFDKTDEKDAVLIARRDQLIVTMTGEIQQIRSLLEGVWPAALDTARQRSGHAPGSPR